MTHGTNHADDGPREPSGAVPLTSPADPDAARCDLCRQTFDRHTLTDLDIGGGVYLDGPPLRVCDGCRTAEPRPLSDDPIPF